MTVDIPKRIIEEHLELEVAARSLRNLEMDPGPTNQEGTILVQIEIVGFAKTLGTDIDDAGWAWFGREVIRRISQATGAPLQCTVEWVPYPASYGAGRQRLEDAAFKAYQGVFGHQHADENVHGDPGWIPIDKILSAARDGGDWSDMATQAEVEAACMSAMKKLMVTNHVNGGQSAFTELVEWAHFQSYWTYTVGSNLPIICATDENPTLWYATTLSERSGPFTAEECDTLVSLELAAYGPTSTDTWKAHMIPQWVMNASKLVYEHLPIEADAQPDS
jgi:hypothetical protein